MGILILSPHLNRRISIVGVEFSRWGKLTQHKRNKMTTNKNFY